MATIDLRARVKGCRQVLVAGFGNKGLADKTIPGAPRYYQVLLALDGCGSVDLIGGKRELTARVYSPPESPGGGLVDADTWGARAVADKLGDAFKGAGQRLRGTRGYVEGGLASPSS